MTGVSGEGVVAEGIQFTDGTCVIRWCCSPAASTVVWATITDAVRVHGHDGSTVVEWVD